MTQLVLAHRADGGQVHAADELLVQLFLVMQEAVVDYRHRAVAIYRMPGRSIHLLFSVGEAASFASRLLPIQGAKLPASHTGPSSVTPRREAGSFAYGLNVLCR